MTRRRTTALLLVVLFLEAILIGLLRSLGWYGTGNALQFTACLAVTFLPLLVAFSILICGKLKFTVRRLLMATTLVTAFFVLSLKPLVQHRAARHTSMRLLAANATINEGLDWDDYYAQLDLDSPPSIAMATTSAVPPWLTSFIKTTDLIPPDDAVQSIWLNSDAQCRILAENWEKLTSLRLVSFSRGVSADGFHLLETILPQIRHLEMVHTNDVVVPAGWYRSLSSIRTLWVWGEGSSYGTPFDREHLNDIARLNLETFMVLGYAFDDDNARKLATSTTLKRVILRGTSVTQAGESELANASRLVFRN